MLTMSTPPRFAGEVGSRSEPVEIPRATLRIDLFERAKPLLRLAREHDVARHRQQLAEREALKNRRDAARAYSSPPLHVFMSNFCASTGFGLQMSAPSGGRPANTTRAALLML